jgi:hypothetical protein
MLRGLLSLGLFASFLSTLGCEAPQANAEAQDQTASMQTAGTQAVLSAKATLMTSAAVGVVDWAFFAGKDGVHLVGSTAGGQPFKTLSTLFRRDKKGTIIDVASHVTNGASFPSFNKNSANSALTPMDPTTQAFVRRAVLDLGRLQVGFALPPPQGSPAQLPQALTCAETLISAIGGGVAGLGTPNLIQSLQGLDATSDQACRAGSPQILGAPSIDQFGEAMCAVNSPCATQIASIEKEDRGGPGTWTPNFLIAGDGRIVPTPVGAPAGGSVGLPPITPRAFSMLAQDPTDDGTPE